MSAIIQTIELLKPSSFYYSITIAMDSTYSYVSDNYQKSFGHYAQPLLGQPFHITLHPDDILVCESVALKCFHNPNELYPATLRKHDGKNGFIFTQWEFKAMLNEAGEPSGIFCIGYNITEHITTQEALIKAKDKVIKHDHTLNEIAFISSHGIRRHLANIQGLMGILNKMDLDEVHKPLVIMIAKSITDMDSEIRKLNDRTI